MENTAQLINKASSGVYHGAPNTSAQLDIATIRGLQFLNSKLPKTASNNGVYSAFKTPHFTDAQISKFERYLEGVENPLLAIKKLPKNQFTWEHSEALKAVYPNLHKQLQQTVMGKITKNPKKYTYGQKLQLGILLGMPTDASMIPGNIGALQANFQSQGPTAGALPQTVTGAGQLGKADRMESGSESSELD
jgi:hypothetical protein